MKKDNKIGAFLVGIGSVSVLAGILLAFIGAPFEQYFFSIFIGLTLAGTAWLNDAKEEAE